MINWIVYTFIDLKIISSGFVTASLIGCLLLTQAKEFRQLLKEISSLREKDSRGLYYVRMELSDLCTAEYLE